MLRLRFPLVSVALSLSVFGCGATKDTGGPGDLTGDTGTGDGFTLDGGDDAPEGSTSLDGLDLDPPNATIVIDTTTSPAKPATVTYKAIARNKDGSSTDVAGTATFTIDDTGLGSFAGSTFTSVDALPGGILGTTTTVKANEGSRSGAANLTIIQLRRQPDAPGTGDFYFEVPYKAPATPDKDVLKFGTKIQQVDVGFNMDTTGSMSGSVSNLQTNLSSTLIPNLKKVIPSVGVAIVDHKDYPVCSHGSAGIDFPVKVYQVVTTDIAKAQAATVSWSASGGADGPESQVPSMWHMLTGGALNWSGGSVPKHTPKPGTVGGVDFRAGALPVLVLITDVSWHDAARDPYCSSVTSPPVVADVKKAFADTKAKFINITSYDEAQADDLSDATKSNIPPGAFAAGAKDCPTGVSGAKRPATGPGGNCRLNFLHSGGTGVSDQVVKAIQAISVGSIFDVTAQAANDPTNPSLSDGGPPVDATQFIKALRAMSEGDAKAGCPSASTKDTDGDGIDDTFTGVKVGTPVCFEVIPAMNIAVPPKPVAQFYKAFINVLGMPGSIKLDQRFVLFLVPPKEIAK